MAIHDSIGDFITIIRNASLAGNKTCKTQFSRIRLEITKILKQEGFILSYEEKHYNSKKVIEINLKYLDKKPAIVNIQRCSRPGCRIYSSVYKIPKVLDGLGTTIISTSKGLLRDTDARKNRVGGEIIIKVW